MFFSDMSKFRKVMKFFIRRKMSSQCSSDYCPQKNLSQLLDTVPVMSIQNCSTQTEFKKAVWLYNTWSALCKRRLTAEPLPLKEFVFWDKNMLR